MVTWRFFPPFPHGVMAAHGSLEPFVLVRVQVRELAADATWVSRVAFLRFCLCLLLGYRVISPKVCKTKLMNILWHKP